MELLENDIKIFDKIIDCTHDINRTYERLYFIDELVESHCDNSDYVLLISQLKDLIKEEKDLYKSLTLTESKRKALLEYFEQKCNLKKIKQSDNFAAACNQEIGDIWFYRIEEQLSTLIPMFDRNSEHVQDLIKQYGDSQELYEYIQEGKLRDAINLDFERAFVYFLQDAIVNSSDYSIKDRLSNVMYNISFITPCIENELINNNFDIFNGLYFLFPCVADSLNMDSEFASEIQEDSTYNYCNDSIDGYSELKELNDDYEEYILQNSLIMKIYFRAGLSLSYNHENYSDIVINMIAQCSNRDDECCDDFVGECLEDSNSDKSKCMYLSLRNPKKG